jgi:sugar lactone lactonase YvrE
MSHVRTNVLIGSLLAIVLASQSAQARPAWGIVVDRRGRVLFADVNNGNCVWMIAENVELSRRVSGKHSHDLFLDADGDLYVSHVTASAGNKWQSSLWRYTPPQSPAIVIAPTENRKAFWGNSFTLDRGGNVYFAYKNNPSAGEDDDEVLLLKRRPDGVVSVLAGGATGHADGSGRRARFRNPGAMAWGPDAALYVTDVDTIRKVSLDGTVTTYLRALNGSQTDSGSSRTESHLFGLTFDEAHSAYVADFGGRRVLKINSNGQPTTALRTEPAWSPVGVTVYGQALYVLEIGTNLRGNAAGPRVRRVTPDGTATILATVKHDEPPRK